MRCGWNAFPSNIRAESNVAPKYYVRKKNYNSTLSQAFEEILYKQVNNVKNLNRNGANFKKIKTKTPPGSYCDAGRYFRNT